MDLLPGDLNLPEEAKGAAILTDYAVLTMTLKERKNSSCKSGKDWESGEIQF
jgi:hypothetical protein